MNFCIVFSHLSASIALRALKTGPQRRCPCVTFTELATKSRGWTATILPAWIGCFCYWWLWQRRTTSIIAGTFRLRLGCHGQGRKVDPTTGGPKPPNVGGFGKRDVYQHFTTKNIPWCCRQTIKNTRHPWRPIKGWSRTRRRARTLQNLWV